LRDEIIIACDLFLDLKLYNLPSSFNKRLSSVFSNVRLIKYEPNQLKLANSKSIKIYWGNRINSEVIKCLPALEWIHLGSVGVNPDVYKEAVKREIIITNSSGLMTNAVAASGLAFIFSLARGFHRSWKIQRENKFNRRAFDEYFNEVQDVFNQSILIAGFGEIGKKIAHSCSQLGLNVSIIRKKYKNKPDWVKRSFPIEKLKNIVSEFDFIVNVLPLNNETKNIFSKEIFRKMKKSAFFINIGRGDTVIESHLIDALKKETIAGAGIDVFSSKSYIDSYMPLKESSPLLLQDNVILMPHVSGVTNKYWDKQCDLFLDNLNKFITKDPLLNQI